METKIADAVLLVLSVLWKEILRHQMTREETKAAIAVMQAYVDGAEIQVRPNDVDGWKDKTPHWNWVSFCYRVKPKPKLELKVGAWYELQSGLKQGRIIQAAEIKPSFVVSTDNEWYPVEKITREVRVLPVESRE